MLDKIYKVFDKKLNLGKNVVICGDFNIAHHEIDLKNFKGNKKNSGFLPDERAWLSKLFKKGKWVDVYRLLHPDDGESSYTWWSNQRAGLAQKCRLAHRLSDIKLRVCNEGEKIECL